jgi:outer membrane protein assembly factor BamB
VLVREGARGLAFLAARDGSRRWSFAGRGDIVGAPTISGDLAAASFERSVQAWKVADGASPWAARLARPTMTGPTPAPSGGFWAMIEPDDVVRIDRTGGVAGIEREVTRGRPSTPLRGNEHGALVGTASGEVVALDDACKVAWRATTEADHPPRWVRAFAGLSLAGDESTVYAFDAKGELQWKHPAFGGLPFGGDEKCLVQSGTRGVEAFER